MSADVDVTSFIDHTEIKAKLSKALREKTTFESKFEVRNLDIFMFFHHLSFLKSHILYSFSKKVGKFGNC